MPVALTETPNSVLNQFRWHQVSCLSPSRRLTIWRRVELQMSTTGRNGLNGPRVGGGGWVRKTKQKCRLRCFNGWNDRKGWPTPTADSSWQLPDKRWCRCPLTLLNVRSVPAADFFLFLNVMFDIWCRPILLWTHCYYSQLKDKDTTLWLSGMSYLLL